MSDPFRWPALTGAALLAGTEIHCEIGIWGKVHRQASDYRWIARGGGFGGQLPDLNRRLRIGGEDRAVRTIGWRAPWMPGGRDYFAIGAYPSRATDAWGRSAVLEKLVLHWRRPAPEFPAALAALALLPAAALGDDRLWWDRVDEGDWQRPDYALPIWPEDCPPVRIDRAGLESVIETGIDTLSRTLDPERLAAVYAGLLSGQRPVLLRGLESPLPPAALAALLLPLTPDQAARCSLAGWVPATLIDPDDLGINWDLAATGQSGPGPEGMPEYQDLGAALAESLLGRDPGPINRRQGATGALQAPGLTDPSAQAPKPPMDDRPGPSASAALVHPNPRMHLGPEGAAGQPGLRYLYRFADRIALRRLDLMQLGEDLSADSAYPLLSPGIDPAGHPLIGWIETLSEGRPDWVEPREWSIKIDQLRAAALFLLPHPRTLDLVGLPESPRVPALLAALAADPSRIGGRLADHGRAGLDRMLRHSLACPDPGLATDIRAWMGQWLAAVGDRDLEIALGALLRPC